MHPKLKLIVALLLTVAFLAGCGQSSSRNNNIVDTTPITIENRPLILNVEKDKVLVYFASENDRYLIPITLPINPTKEAAKVAIEKVLAGPGDWLLSNTIPEGTKLIDLYIRDTLAYVDLTSHFKNFREYKSVEMAIDSLVLTITEFSDVEQVQFLIEGVMVADINGFELNKTFVRPLFINTLGDINEEDKRLHVYFSDPNALYVVPVGFSVSITSDTIQVVERVMQELIKGPPQDSDLIGTIWPGTRLISVSYYPEDELVAINLSEEAIGYGGGAAMEMLFINSLLHSVTSIEGVNWVQILIEGEKTDYLPEGTDVSAPITRQKNINFISL